MKKLILFLSILLCSPVFAADQDQQFEGFNLSGYTQTGEKSWDVKGDTANILGATINLSNIVAKAYGEQKIHLTADSGSIDQENNQMHLEKNVVISSENGSTLKTDSLDWSQENDLVSTQAPVTITDERMTASGVGMTAQPNLKTAQMQEDVKVDVKTELDKFDGKVVSITCDGPLEIDQAKQQAIFNKNVVAIQAGRELRADRIEIYFDQANNQIKEMVCIGNVSILQGENTTYSEKAVYSAQDQKLILSGRPKLILLTEGENSIATFGD